MARQTRRIAGAWVLAPLLLAPLSGRAQEPAAPAPATRPAPRPDQLEPGVDTSKLTESVAPGEAPAAPETQAAAPQAATAPATQPAAAPATAAAPQAGARKGNDRLNLDTTDVRGNHELPKVMYIVPWKRSDLGDLVGRPPNSLLDEVLQPLDRDVFKRETRYYEALRPDQAGVKADAVQGSDAKP
jgi:hypothetical protein